MKKAIFIIWMLIVIFSINTVVGIFDKSLYEYSVQRSEYEMNILQPGCEVEYAFEAIQQQIEYLDVYVDGSSWREGGVICNIKEGNQVLFSKTSDAKEILSGYIRFDLRGCTFYPDKEYKIQFVQNGSDVIGIYSDVDNMLKCKYYVKFMHVFLFVLAVILISILYFVLCCYVCSKKSDEKTFLAIAVLTGIWLILLIPPYTAPDEMRHLARAYDIANGNVVCHEYEGGEQYGNHVMPVCEFPIELYNLKYISQKNGENYTQESNSAIYYDVYYKAMSKSFSGNTVKMPIHGDSTTSSLAFLPQVVGIWIGKMLHLPVGIFFYFVRFMNLLFSIMLAYIGFKLLKGYREVYCLIYFAPGISYLRSTSSTDGWLLSIVLLFVALVLYVKREKIKFWTAKIALSFILLIALIAVIKLPYVLVGGLLLILDEQQFTMKKIRKSGWIFKIVSLGFVLGIGMMLYWGSHKILDVNAGVLSNTYASSTEISADYVRYFLDNKIAVVNMLLKTFVQDLYIYVQGAVALPVGEYLVLPFVVWCSYVIGKGTASGKLLGKSARIYSGVLGGMIWFSVIVAFYFVGPAPDLGYIWGVQGRYLYPALPVIGIAICRDSENAIPFKYLMIGCIGFLCIHMINIFEYYWV